MWWPKWGRGHPPRERELARGALPTSPKPVGVPVRRSLRKGIWLQWASRNKKNEPSARRLQRDERAPTVLDGAPRTARAGPHLLTGIQGVGEG